MIRRRKSLRHDTQDTVRVRSLSAGEHKDAEEADQRVLEIRVVVHDDCDHANIRQVAHGAPDDVFLVEPTLVRLCILPDLSSRMRAYQNKRTQPTHAPRPMRALSQMKYMRKTNTRHTPKRRSGALMHDFSRSPRRGRGRPHRCCPPSLAHPLCRRIFHALL